jgi:hypothetical protein
MACAGARMPIDVAAVPCSSAGKSLRPRKSSDVDVSAKRRTIGFSSMLAARNDSGTALAGVSSQPQALPCAGVIDWPT